MTDPRPDFIGPREGAQAFLERETNNRPGVIRRWLSLIQRADQEWPFATDDDPYLTVFIRFRQRDEKFEVRISRGHPRPSHASPAGLG